MLNPRHRLPSVIFLTLAFIILGCMREPRSLTFQKHSCDQCKMLLMDNRYGALIETSKGKVYRFDDINCMINFMHENFAEGDQLPFKQVIDFTNPGILVSAEEAFYLKSDSLKTPMNSHVAAFHTKKDLDRFKKEYKGIYLVWGELITQFK